MQPGDLVLFQTPRDIYNVDAILVWLGQRVRVELGTFNWYKDIPKRDLRKMCKYTHSAVIAETSPPPGTLIQADQHGAHEDAVWAFRPTDTVIDTKDTPEDRAEVVAAGRAVLKHTYGWVRFLFIASSYLTRLAISFGIDGWKFCSGLSAFQLERGNLLGKGAFPRDAENMAPLDLAAFYYEQVKPTLG